MAQGIQFTGAYEPAAQRTLIPGGWYIGFACEGCGRHFAILNEPTATGTLDITGTAIFRTTCPNCSLEREYSADDLVQFQAAQGGSSSTA